MPLMNWLCECGRKGKDCEVPTMEDEQHAARMIAIDQHRQDPCELLTGPEIEANAVFRGGRWLVVMLKGTKAK